MEAMSIEDRADKKKSKKSYLEEVKESEGYNGASVKGLLPET